MAEYQSHEYDVIVIGAGGAGLRAAIESSALGAKTALVCKSLHIADGTKLVGYIKVPWQRPEPSGAAREPKAKVQANDDESTP